MSTPENILSKYRTYSYHHTLVACENTEVAEALAKSTNMYKYINTVGEERYTPNSVSRDVNNNSGGLVGDYIILTNSMVDSDFFIDELKWLTTIHPAAQQEGEFEQFSTFASEGSFEVTEPKGVDFLNVISQAAFAFGTDTTNLVFMLKTFFVGDADTPRVDYITTIKPLIFIMTDITAKFDNSGSIYSIELMNISNGAAKLPQVLNGAHKVSINMSGSEKPTIKDAMDEFQSVITKQYDIHYEKMTEAVQKTTGAESPGTRVTYIIKVDPDSGYGEYLMDQLPETRSDKGETQSGGILNFGKNPSIESAILDILQSSSQFGQDAVSDNDEKKRYLPKVSSTIHSGKKGNDKFYNVVYNVTRMEQPVSTLENIHNLDQKFKKAGNNITFDYYFAGKNTDIIDFNLQMNMGLAFFASLETSRSLEISAASDITTENNTHGTTSDRKAGPHDWGIGATIAAQSRTVPVFFSTQFDAPKEKNKIYTRAASSFQKALRAQASIEMLDAKITILGNPILLNNSILSPSEIIAGKPDPTPTVLGDGEDSDVMRDWTTVPGLVKVNIFSPSVNADDGNRKPFWYDGWYYVTAVEHMFSRGQFTQTIEMMSLPIQETGELPDENPATVTAGGQEQ